MGTTRRGFGRGFPAEKKVILRDVIRDTAASNLGNIFTKRSGSKFMSGARAVIKINGRLIGFAFDVSWSIRTDASEIYTIDDPSPYEIAPKRVSVSGSLGLFQMPGRSMQNEVIQPDMYSFLSNKYISIEIRDSLTDEIIFFTDKAMVVSQDSSLASENLGATKIQWVATGWRAEKPPEIPKNIDDNRSLQQLDQSNPIAEQTSILNRIT